jgi:hypothetical protein
MSPVGKHTVWQDLYWIQPAYNVMTQLAKKQDVAIYINILHTHSTVYCMYINLQIQ